MLGDDAAWRRPAEGADKDRLIEALRAENRELASGIAARDAFLAVAAHELRNPMTPIIGQVQRLRRQVGAGLCTLADVGERIKRIEWLMEMYVKRATTLLDVSRITSGKLRLDLSDFDVGALVRATAEAMEPVFQYSGSSLVLSIDENVPVRADRLAIEQIVDNLLLNGVKYGAGKPVEITVVAKGDDFCLSVRDHGVGMSETDQRRIFEPFERAISYEAKAGFGIGLWVVRQLVDAMGGHIQVESAPGAGTTFAVVLRRRIPEPSEISSAPGP